MINFLFYLYKKNLHKCQFQLKMILFFVSYFITPYMLTVFTETGINNTKYTANFNVSYPYDTYLYSYSMLLINIK